MSTTPHIDPKDWQSLYSENRAHRDSLKKAGKLILPVLSALLPPLLFLIIYTARLLENQPTQEIVKWRLAQGIMLMIVLIIFTLLCIRYLFKTAARFLEKFHNLTVENDAASLVRLRVLGLPPLPPPLSTWIKFPAVSLKGETLDPPDHWSTSVGGPAKLNISTGHAFYLERGGYFSRVVGQGSAFLDWNERISAVVNVGPHSEEMSITAWTKEGIKVDVKAKGEYFLGHSRTEDEDNILIPFDAEAIRKAVEHTFKSGKEANEWLISAVMQTKGILGSYISNQFLDDLFLKDNSSLTLLSNANIKEMHNTINARLQQYGVYLSNFQIFDIILPPKVRELRVEIWKAHHKNIEVVTDGEVKAHQIRMREKARAEIQRDLIFTLANGLDRIDSNNFPEPLLLSISVLLDQNMKDPTVRANLAKESLETLEKMQEAIKFPLQLPGEDT